MTVIGSNGVTCERVTLMSAPRPTAADRLNVSADLVAAAALAKTILDGATLRDQQRTDAAAAHLAAASAPTHPGLDAYDQWALQTFPDLTPAQLAERHQASALAPADPAEAAYQAFMASTFGGTR